MYKTKLNYRFHNPNTAEASAEHILRVLIDANRNKAEDAIKHGALQEETLPTHHKEQRT